MLTVLHAEVLASIVSASMSTVCSAVAARPYAVGVSCTAALCVSLYQVDCACTAMACYCTVLHCIALHYIYTDHMHCTFRTLLIYNDHIH
jgi:hypothetical protein